MLDWSSASGHLLQDGPERGLRMLDRLASGELPARAEPGSGTVDDEAAVRSRALRLAGAAFGASVLLVAGPQPAAPGLNLWTAELVFIGAALALLAGSLRRLMTTSWR